MGLCFKGCCNNETDKILKYTEQYESLLQKNYLIHFPDDQDDFFNWAYLIVRSAVRLLTFYNLSSEHFEDVLLLNIKSAGPKFQIQELQEEREMYTCDE